MNRLLAFFVLLLAWPVFGQQTVGVDQSGKLVAPPWAVNSPNGIITNVIPGFGFSRSGATVTIPNPGFVPSVNYYVDSINGDDSNSGLGTNSAWQTVTHANAAAIPGYSSQIPNQVFLIGGDNFPVTTMVNLTTPNILWTSFGAAQAIVTGTNQLGLGLWRVMGNGITVTNIAFQGTSTFLTNAVLYTGAGVFRATGVGFPPLKNDSVLGCTFTNLTTGILDMATNGAGGAINTLYSDNVIEYMGFAGIASVSVNQATVGGYLFTNTTVSYNEIDHVLGITNINSGSGFALTSQTNENIFGNVIHDNGMNQFGASGGAGGIVVVYTDGFHIYNNIVYDIWNVQPFGEDGVGIDPDIRAQDGVIEQNLVFHCHGCGYDVFDANKNIVWRNNLGCFNGQDWVQGSSPPEQNAEMSFNCGIGLSAGITNFEVYSNILVGQNSIPFYFANAFDYGANFVSNNIFVTYANDLIVSDAVNTTYPSNTWWVVGNGQDQYFYHNQTYTNLFSWTNAIGPTIAPGSLNQNPFNLHMFDGFSNAIFVSIFRSMTDPAWGQPNNGVQSALYKNSIQYVGSTGNPLITGNNSFFVGQGVAPAATNVFGVLGQGNFALNSLKFGSNVVADGNAALFNLTNGTTLYALGNGAGANVKRATNNIYLEHPGVDGDVGQVYIGFSETNVNMPPNGAGLNVSGVQGTPGQYLGIDSSYHMAFGMPSGGGGGAGPFNPGQFDGIGGSTNIKSGASLTNVVLDNPVLSNTMTGISGSMISGVSNIGVPVPIPNIVENTNALVNGTEGVTNSIVGSGIEQTLNGQEQIAQIWSKSGNGVPDGDLGFGNFFPTYLLTTATSTLTPAFQNEDEDFVINQDFTIAAPTKYVVGAFNRASFMVTNSDSGIHIASFPAAWKNNWQAGGGSVAIPAGAVEYFTIRATPTLTNISWSSPIPTTNGFVATLNGNSTNQNLYGNISISGMMTFNSGGITGVSPSTFSWGTFSMNSFGNINAPLNAAIFGGLTSDGTLNVDGSSELDNGAWTSDGAGNVTAVSFNGKMSGNGTNLLGVVVTNNAQVGYEPIFTGTGTGINGVTWVPSTNIDVVSTVVFSNIPPLIRFTNTTGSALEYLSGISNVSASVLGSNTFVVAISNANSPAFSNTYYGQQTIIGSAVTTNFTGIKVILNTNAVLVMTDMSSGALNVSGQVPGSGQILTIGNATASGVPSLGGNNTFTGNQTYSFPNGSNVVISSSGVAVNGGTYTGDARNTTNAQIPIISEGAGVSLNSTLHYYYVGSTTTGTFPTISNVSTFLSGVHTFSVIHGQLAPFGGTSLVGTNAIVTLYTNGNGTGPMAASALTAQIGNVYIPTISTVVLTNAWIALEVHVTGAGSLTAYSSITLDNQ